jgi:hypothetical protein
VLRAVPYGFATMAWEVPDPRAAGCWDSRTGTPPVEGTLRIESPAGGRTVITTMIPIPADDPQ